MTDLYLYKDKDSLIISGIDKCPEDEPRMARNVDDIHLLTADSPQDAKRYYIFIHTNISMFILTTKQLQIPIKFMTMCYKVWTT